MQSSNIHFVQNDLARKVIAETRHAVSLGLTPMKKVRASQL